MGDIAIHVAKTYLQRRALVHAGWWIDIPYAAEDKIYELPPLSPQQLQQDFIEWPLPALTRQLKKEQLKEVTLDLEVAGSAFFAVVPRPRSRRSKGEPSS